MPSRPKADSSRLSPPCPLARAELQRITGTLPSPDSLVKACSDQLPQLQGWPWLPAAPSALGGLKHLPAQTKQPADLLARASLPQDEMGTEPEKSLCVQLLTGLRVWCTSKGPRHAAQIHCNNLQLLVWTLVAKYNLGTPADASAGTMMETLAVQRFLPGCANSEIQRPALSASPVLICFLGKL